MGQKKKFFYPAAWALISVDIGQYLDPDIAAVIAGWTR